MLPRDTVAQWVAHGQAIVAAASVALQQAGIGRKFDPASQLPEKSLLRHVHGDGLRHYLAGAYDLGLCGERDLCALARRVKGYIPFDGLRKHLSIRSGLRRHRLEHLGEESS